MTFEESRKRKPKEKNRLIRFIPEYLIECLIILHKTVRLRNGWRDFLSVLNLSLHCVPLSHIQTIEYSSHENLSGKCKNKKIFLFHYFTANRLILILSLPFPIPYRMLCPVLSAVHTSSRLSRDTSQRLLHNLFSYRAIPNTCTIWRTWR